MILQTCHSHLLGEMVWDLMGKDSNGLESWCYCLLFAPTHTLKKLWFLMESWILGLRELEGFLVSFVFLSTLPHSFLPLHSHLVSISPAFDSIAYIPDWTAPQSSHSYDRGDPGLPAILHHSVTCTDPLVPCYLPDLTQVQMYSSCSIDHVLVWFAPVLKGTIPVITVCDCGISGVGRD